MRISRPMAGRRSGMRMLCASKGGCGGVWFDGGGWGGVKGKGTLWRGRKAGGWGV